MKNHAESVQIGVLIGINRQLMISYFDSAIVLMIICYCPHDHDMVSTKGTVFFL